MAAELGHTPVVSIGRHQTVLCPHMYSKHSTVNNLTAYILSQDFKKILKLHNLKCMSP